MGDVVAAVGVAHEGFGALGRPLDRAPDLLGRPGDDRLLGIVIDLGAEAPTHVGGHDAQLVLGDAEDEGAHQEADHVRVLARGVERVVARGGIVLADRGARLDRVRDEAVVDEVDLGDLGGLGEGRVVGRLVAELPIVAGIRGSLVPNERCSRLERVRDRDDGRQLLVAHLDELGRIARLGAALRDHDGDLVAHVSHPVGDECGVRRLDHRRAVLVVDKPAARQPVHLVADKIGPREDRDHARRLRRLGDAELLDLRVRVGRAQDVGVGLIWTTDVVGVVAAARQEPGVLFAQYARANAGVGHVTSPSWRQHRPEWT